MCALVWGRKPVWGPTCGWRSPDNKYCEEWCGGTEWGIYMGIGQRGWASFRPGQQIGQWSTSSHSTLSSPLQWCRHPNPGLALLFQEGQLRQYWCGAVFVLVIYCTEYLTFSWSCNSQSTLLCPVHVLHRVPHFFLVMSIPLVLLPPQE